MENHLLSELVRGVQLPEEYPITYQMVQDDGTLTETTLEQEVAHSLVKPCDLLAAAKGG